MSQNTDATPTGEKEQELDPDRLMGRRYEVKLSYTVDYRLSVIAGPEDWQAVDEAKVVANPTGCVGASDWDLVNKDVEAVEDIWMDDPRAPEAAGWLDEPHLPSEETFWDDSRHFEEVDCDA